MTDTIKIIKPHPASEPKGAPIKAPVWRNLHFIKSGKSYMGLRTYSSEQHAREFAERQSLGVPEYRPNGTVKPIYCLGGNSSGVFDRRFDFMPEEYSHTIQIPARPK
jgi:hypothetical protein